MIKRITGALMLLLLFAGCGKDEGSYIPNILVNYRISIQQFKIESAKTTNGILTVDNYGVAGLIIIEVAPRSYVAFDRCSSVNPEQRCQVVADNRFTATDPCSGAKFSLIDGSPSKAPAVRYLKSYRVHIGSDDMINVSN
ncbi:Rieske (2Fe-2S) protein [Pedobacter caeni]|nr:hypothetical protein [Pedobacter caeni]